MNREVRELGSIGSAVVVSGRRSRRPLWYAALALTFALIAPWFASVAVADTVDVEVTIPEPPEDGRSPGQNSGSDLKITNAELRWGINVEVNSGAFFGGCNWVQAGEAGDWGSSQVWSDARFWKSSEGNVRILKPDAQGRRVEPTWDNRCMDLTGSTPRPVTTQETHSVGGGTKAEVVISAGTGSYDAETDTLRIQWKGSFTVVFYGGMTYWWARDPVLEIKNGTGVLSADLGGYGADMMDTSRWEALPIQRNVPMAALTGVTLQRDANGLLTGFTHRPDYEGVAINVKASGPSQPQNRTVNGWGSFPQKFIDFHVLTGQAAYWYTSGGIRDAAKPPHNVVVSFDASKPIDVGDGADLPVPDSSGGSGQIPQGGQGQLPSAAPQPASSGQQPVPAGPAAGQTTVLPNTYQPLDLSALIESLKGNDEQVEWFAGEAPEVQSIDWLGRGLIPASVAELVKDYQQNFWWSLLGLLVLGGTTAFAYRRGWLTVPWK